jgi:hypothetical protein
VYNTQNYWVLDFVHRPVDSYARKFPVIIIENKEFGWFRLCSDIVHSSFKGYDDGA